MIYMFIYIYIYIYPELSKDMKIVKANPEEVEVLAPLPFIENYF